MSSSIFRKISRMITNETKYRNFRIDDLRMFDQPKQKPNSNCKLFRKNAISLSFFSLNKTRNWIFFSDLLWEKIWIKSRPFFCNNTHDFNKLRFQKRFKISFENFTQPIKTTFTFFLHLILWKVFNNNFSHQSYLLCQL